MTHRLTWIVSFILLVLSMFLLDLTGTAWGQSCTPGGGVTCTSNLNLWLPPAHYQNWDIPMNANSNTLDAFSITVVLFNPLASQSVATPLGYNFNLGYPLVYNPGGTGPVLLKFGTAPNIWDTALTRTAAGTLSLDTTTAGNSLGILTTGGYQVSGAAASGTLLCGNGTVYTSCSISGLPGVFYQTVASNNTSQTQRAVLNFSTRFSTTDSSSPAETTIDLATTGVTAGSYTATNITVNAQGQVTAAASGTAPVAFVQTDQTASRAFDTVYQNTSTNGMEVDGWVTTTAGGADGNITCYNGTTSSTTSQPFGSNPTATDAGGESPFHISVPPSWYYKCHVQGSMNAVLGKWYETVH